MIILNDDLKKKIGKQKRRIPNYGKIQNQYLRNTHLLIILSRRMCDEYIKEKETQEHPFSAFEFIAMYDMWLNKSPVWPVPFNPEWERWNKLKAVKVKRKKVDD